MIQYVHKNLMDKNNKSLATNTNIHVHSQTKNIAKKKKYTDKINKKVIKN